MSGKAEEAFDAIADDYDARRGGENRAIAFAGVLEKLLIAPGLTVEAGVGTGIVAAELRRRGRAVVGFDVSAGMLRHSLGRLPGLVVRADVTRIPLADGCAGNVYAIWMLHLIENLDTALLNICRILKPSGRLVVVPAANTSPEDPIGAIVNRVQRALLGPRLNLGSERDVTGAAVHAGLSFVGSRPIQQMYPLAPQSMAHQLEIRNFSSLRDVNDAQWTSIVEPAIQELRSFPNADVPLMRSTVHTAFTFASPSRLM